MQATEKKRTRAVRRRGMVFLRLVLSVLGVGAVVVLSAKAWLAMNDAVRSDMEKPLYSQAILLELSEGVDANGKYIFEASGDPVGLKLDKPGSTAAYMVQVENRGNCDVNLISFGLLAPAEGPAEGEETAITFTTDGAEQSCFLGTQISVMLSQVNDVPFDGEIVGALASVSDGAVIAGDIELLREKNAGENSKVQIGAGESATFTVTFTFVETNTDQNVYRNFREHGGVCSRRFFAECEAVDSEPDIPEISNP